MLSKLHFYFDTTQVSKSTFNFDSLENAAPERKSRFDNTKSKSSNGTFGGKSFEGSSGLKHENDGSNNSKRNGEKFFVSKGNVAAEKKSRANKTKSNFATSTFDRKSFETSGFSSNHPGSSGLQPEYDDTNPNDLAEKFFEPKTLRDVLCICLHKDRIYCPQVRSKVFSGMFQSDNWQTISNLQIRSGEIIHAKTLQYDQIERKYIIRGITLCDKPSELYVDLHHDGSCTVGGLPMTLVNASNLLFHSDIFGEIIDRDSITKELNLEKSRLFGAINLNENFKNGDYRWTLTSFYGTMVYTFLAKEETEILKNYNKGWLAGLTDVE